MNGEYSEYIGFVRDKIMCFNPENEMTDEELENS